MANLLQWNCQGLRSKKDELLELINRIKPSAIALQETKLWNNIDFKIPNYTIHRKDGHFNVSPHGGVAILIHESVPFNNIPLNTEHQAIAIRVQLCQPLTICSIYLSRSHAISQNSITNIIQQLPPPLIIMGDFNSYNTVWGSERTDARGRIVEEAINNNNLNILNNGLPTRIAYNTESAIDLTVTSPILDPILQWSVAPTPLDSDHCPISVMFMNNRPEQTIEQKRNIKRADWGSYASSPVWQNPPQDITTISNEHLLNDLYDRFNKSIPTNNSYNKSF